VKNANSEQAIIASFLSSGQAIDMGYHI